MAQLKKPILLDETGQAIVSAINNIKIGKVDEVSFNGASVVVDREATIPYNLSNYNNDTDFQNSIQVESAITSKDYATNTKVDGIDDRLDIAEGQIDNLKNLGKFLAIWDCETGQPTTQPPRPLPFNYSVGDYYRVGNVGTTNYKPNGSQYTGQASTTLETEEITIGAVYYYDGTNWAMQSAGAGGKVQDVQVNGTSILSSGIANIPFASNTAVGVVKSGGSFGTDIILSSGTITTVKATDTDIANKTNNYKPIVPSNLQLAVDTGVKGSTNYQSFSCEMADGTNKTLKLYAELI